MKNITVRNLAVKKDIKNLSKNDLTKKLRDYKYRYNYLKEISLSNNNIGINNEKLKEFFINEFGNLNYNFNNLSEKEKSDIIEKYKQRKKLDDDANINLNQIINLDIQCRQISLFIRNKIYKNKNLNDLL